MINCLLSFAELFKEGILINKRLNEVIKNYQLFYVQENLEFDQKAIIFQNFKDSKIAIINQVKETTSNDENKFLIICFKNTIIMINQASLIFLLDLFNSNLELTIYFLSNTNNIFENQKIFIKNKKYNSDDNFLSEIDNFNEALSIRKRLKIQTILIWNAIQSSLSGYLIKQSYEKLNKNRFENFIKSNFSEDINYNDKEYIELRCIENTNSSNISLVYNIEKEELLVVKKSTSNKNTNLIRREQYNYSKINHPLIPKYYGLCQEKNCLFIEFINGKILYNIQNFHFEYNEKISIIFQLILIFKYIHDMNFVYRDLKPNNVMIDENKNVILLDFDRMIPPSKNSDFELRTTDFSHVFVPPEVNYGKISYKNDIYSLGKMIYYIITEEMPNDDNNINKLDSKMKLFYHRCTNKNPKYRPCINKLYIDFFDNFESFIHNSIIERNIEILYFLGCNYYEGKFISRNMNKAIHFFKLASDQNHLKSQYELGCIYYHGLFVSKDINKAIHYLEQAANQNHLNSQIIMGNIYYNNIEVPRNIKKAIYYYKLASNQNSVFAQFNLGEIYYDRFFVQRNINKAIYYYSLAADLNNHAKAQYSLGIIYSNNECVSQDLNKAIHYYSLAANQNHSNSQFNLGMIYYNNKNSFYDINKAIYYFKLAADLNNKHSQYVLGVIYSKSEYIPRNIEKAIHYYQLAANQNHPNAQYNLGLIYYNSLFASQNINKAIYYFQLAANNNIEEAQYDLGMIYISNKYIPMNIEKAIYYFQLAANQNYVDSQYNLGIIYLTNKYVPKNINKSIHYFTLAANQNFAQAQYNLGVIYIEGLLTTRDIEKAIYYFQLAANQNFVNAQYYLGKIYLTNKYIPINFNRSIHYLTLAANQNFADAQYYLGIIYSENTNKFIHYMTLAANQNHPNALFFLGIKNFQFGNINKGIQYFTLSANNNNSHAQSILGLMYFYGQYVHYNAKKAVDFITKSAENRNINSHFILGFLYHEGKCIKQDIKKSIHYYKEASSFNNQYAKNNLGILYKNGFGDEVPHSIEFAIEYFKEAIRQKNDKVSMYNLAHLYLYNNPNEISINESINLLIQSSKLDFPISIHLLSLTLIKKYGNDLKIIKKELDRYSNDSCNLSHKVCQKIKSLNFFDPIVYSFTNEIFLKIDFLYGPSHEIIQSNNLNNWIKKELNQNLKINDINSEFYDGFGF